MKKIIFLLTILNASNFCYSQFNATREPILKYEDYDNRKFGWGYFLGINSFEIKLHPNQYGLDENKKYLINSDVKPGMTVGLMGKMRLNEHLDLKLEPAIHFTRRTLFFENIRKMAEYDHKYNLSQVERNLKSSYLDIPISINFHGNRWGNSRPFIQSGFGLLFNLSSDENKKGDNYDGIFRTKTLNFSYNIEGGISFYFKYFKLTNSVKGIFFINNEIVKDNPGTEPIWAGAITSLRTRAVMFSLKFE